MLNKWQGIAAATASATLVAFTACGKGNRNNVDTTTAATPSGEVARSDSAATATAPLPTPPSHRIKVADYTRRGRRESQAIA